MLFSGLALFVSAACAAPLLSIRGSYDGEMIRGVNLGGWLVLEPWITPSIWNQWGPNPPVDEFGLCAADRNKAQSVFSQHWASFITEDDFHKIKASGFNAVRLPIGYWAFTKVSGDAFVSGQAEYLDKALGWASSAGLGVLIDLHGAPGSQNGFDNSGRRGMLDWQKGNNVQITLDVLATISKKYASHPAVMGIGLLNEILGGPMDMNGVRQFNHDGYGKVREVSGSCAVVVGDAFQQPSSWNGQFPDTNVIIDHHKYFVFDTGSMQMSEADRIGAACSNGETAGTSNKVIVGEWSGAIDDCAYWLNGVGRGSRYEGQYQSSYVGKCGRQGGEIGSWSDDIKQHTATFISAQMVNYETRAHGWFFWTWKTENQPAWDANRLVDAGLFKIGGNNPCH